MVDHQSPELGGGRGGSKRNFNSSPPPKYNASTFDWEGQRDRYWRTLDWQALVKLSDNLDAQAHRLRMQGRSQEAERLVKKQYPVKIQGAWGGSKTKYDRQAMIDLYLNDRLTVKEIAERFGCDQRTVREALRANSVYTPERDLKPPPTNRSSAKTYTRSKTCSRGLHDMDKYGREVTGKKGANGQPKKNGRYCYACQRINQGADSSLFDEVEGDIT